MQCNLVIRKPFPYDIRLITTITGSRVEDREKIIKVGNYVVRITDA